MSEKNTCVSIYSTYQAAEQALGKLQKQGVDLRQVSIVGKGSHDEEHPIGFYTAGERIRYRGFQATFWDSLWRLLAGAAFFWVPGFGSLAAAGPVVNLLVDGVEGIAIGSGFGVLGAALFNMGVPRANTIQYEHAVKDENFLLLVHGERKVVEHACSILHSETQQVAVHAA